MREWLRRARQLPVAVLVILFVGVALLSITPVSPPSFLLDADWANGLNWAILTHKQFGVDIDFTAGPLANLDEPSILSPLLYIPAALGTIATGVAIAFLAWRFARTWLPRLASALIVTFVIAPAVIYSDIFSARILLLSVMCAVALLTGVVDRKWVTAILVILSVFSGVALLAKFSNGTLSIATIVLIAALCTEGGVVRRGVTAVASLLLSAISVVLLWVSTGQQLAHFGPWLSASLQLTSGYPEAMSTDDRALIVQYVALVLVTVVVVLQALTRRGPSRWFLLIVVAWVFAMGLRLGFTRHDLGHATESFALLAVVALGLGISRQIWMALAAVIVSVATLFSSVTIYAGLYNPRSLAIKSRAEVLSIVSTTYREGLLDKARVAGRARYSLSPAILNDLHGKSVHVDPIEVNAAWAYSLDWNPVPVFQSYSAYTPALDAINARALVSKKGPDVVLRGTMNAIDGRNPMWESPLYTKALVCDFRPSSTSKTWLALDKSSNRCGTPTVLSTVKFTAGESVPVPKAPSPGYMIVASLSTSNPIANALATQVFKPLKKVVVTTNQGAFRLPRAHESGPLILELPKSAGWAAPFGGKTNVTTIAVNESGTVVFSAVRVN